MEQSDDKSKREMMSDTTGHQREDGLTMESPFIRRFFAWVQERFPLANALLFFALWAAAFVTGRVMSVPKDEVPSMAALSVVGFFGAWGYFLLLRVYDEHKDYELDVHNFPNRVLQSGLITLNHLKGAGVIAVFVQLGVTLWLGQGVGPALWCWLIVMTWSALMGKEFFIGEWLEKRLVLYALSHMIVMPMALIWMAHLGAQGQWLSPSLGWLAGAAFCSGAAFEVTRKTRAPEEERDTVDSYARVLGLKTACMVVLVFLCISVGCQLTLIHTVRGLSAGWIGACVAPLLLPLWAFVTFMREPVLKRRGTNEASVALAMLAGYIVMIAAMLTARGMQWSVLP